jgi:hypothetical protein
MAFLTEEISKDPRVQICDGVLYFDGSPDQLIAIILQDVVEAVQRRGWKSWGKGER